jgi:hypothetical protein
VIGAALLAALAAAAAAAPAAPPPAPAAVEAVDGRLFGAVDLAPALPDGLERQLANGLTNVIAVHVALLPARGGDPAAIWAREIRILYDVWEERFGVVVREPGAPAGRRLGFATVEELRSWLARLEGVPLGPAPALGDRAWVLQARVELNPVSKELLDRTRELIANPSAGPRGGPSRSVLGAMASYLIREPSPGAEVHVLRSPPFTAAGVRRR